jgi:8-oxo-dGTP pyrophosphatase MutT (NUDIX family)
MMPAIDITPDAMRHLYFPAQSGDESTRCIPAPSFVVSAGCVLFRHAHNRAEPLQVCLLYCIPQKQWLLAKGRVERGESYLAAALRETTEETGYPCRPLPVRMATRAPASGADIVDTAEGETVDDCTEPFIVTLRETPAGTKIIWWYIVEVVDEDAPPVADRREEDENVFSQFIDIDSAWPTFQSDRDVLGSAVNLVKETYRGT